MDKINPEFDFVTYALTVRKNNSDEWMEGFINKANEMLKSLGDEGRLEYKNGEVRDINFKLPISGGQ